MSKDNSTKFMNANSAENIASYARVEMFGIDQNQSYGLAFAYIRPRDVVEKCFGSKNKRCVQIGVLLAIHKLFGMF